jgi:Tol biopolymer transport system component
MLSGSPPHVGATAQQIVMKIVMEPAQPVTQLRRSVPPNVAAAASKALEKLPADRFETARAFADALGNPAYALASTATHVAPGTPARARRNLAIWLSALLIALVVGAWGWLRPKPAAPVRWLSLALPDSQALGSGLAFRLALSPDGERVAYVGAGTGAAAVTKIWLRRLGALVATALPGTEEGYNPSFSPDGRRLAFVSGNPRTVKAIPLAGGPAISLTDSLVDRGGLAWGYDGYIYYDGHLQGDGIARVSENGGVPEIVSRPDSARGEFFHNGPAPLPNGRGVIIAIVRQTTNPEATEVGVVDLRTGKHKSLTRGVGGIYSPTGHLLYVTADGTLMAAPFDQDRLELTGEGVALTSGVSVRAVSRVDLSLGGGNLVYSSGSGEMSTRELVWTARNGAATPIDPDWTANMGNPRLSPDGRRLTVTVAQGSDVDVWVKQLDRGPVLKLSQNGGQSATWSPDGRSVVYVVPSRGILRVPADGSALPATLKPAGRQRIQSAAVSPDGQWLVYGLGLNLYMARISGDTVPREIAATQAIELSPAVSPDGRWIAYTSDELGRFEVYVRPFPETQTTRWLVSNRGGSLPRWSRGGKELFFINANGDLVAVPVNPGPVFSFGVPMVLFTTEPFGALNGAIAYDVHPDGKRFVMLRPMGSAMRRDELILVENLFGELQAKVKQ